MNSGIAVVINSQAGKNADGDLCSRVRDLFSAHGCTVQVAMPDTPGDMQDAITRFLESGCGVLAAGGGDGTISAAAARLIGGNVRLGVLPLGTLNHFARDLGLPTDLEGACAAICHGQAKRVDAGRVNGRIFLNNSGAGLYPSVVRRREWGERTGRSRLLAFSAAVLQVLRRYPFLELELDMDGKKMFRRSSFLFVGNNEYQLEGLSFGTRPNLNSGLLSVVVSNRAGRFGLFRIALAALFHRLPRNRDIEILATASVRIRSSKKSLRVSLDGELTRLETPLIYECLPGALQVMAPA
ncbi:MAG: diacylglycerol kinase family lipid kinase [Acidobacteriota bacterium]|nr:diacylglycerol kinase family lipid kinase [Acidobacteriota bacterium]